MTKQIYVVRKYVYAESIEEAIKLEKKIAPADIYLTEYSTAAHLEELSPKKDTTGFKEKKNDSKK